MSTLIILLRAALPSLISMRRTVVIPLFFVSPAIASVGTTQGQFIVNSNGAATYSIPVTVVPGVAGLAPRVSLEYSSQGGEGIAGMGWSISAGSGAISRCPANLAQDGFVDPVDFDSSDKLCLGGSRLIATQGTYGNSGTVYRTEVESFSRITQTGSINGSASFKVESKDGTTMFYGAVNGIAGATPVVLGKTPTGQTRQMSWLAARLTDSAGNSLNYEYLNGNNASVHNQLRLSEIRYGTANEIWVRFNYDPRSDSVPTYSHGVRQDSPWLLSSVETGIHSQAYRSYNLAYDYYPLGSVPLVSSVTECAYSNGGSAECLNPTEFSWSQNQQNTGYTLKNASNVCSNNGGESNGDCNSDNNHNYIKHADIDGDGDIDSCFRGDARGIQCYVNESTHWSGPILANACSNDGTPGDGGCNGFNNWDTIGFLDFNGDAKADIFYRADNGMHVRLSTGTSFNGGEWFTPHCKNDGAGGDGGCNGTNNHPYIFHADVSGDSLPDTCYRADNGMRCLINNGNGWQSQLWSTPICANNNVAGNAQCNGDNNYRNIRLIDYNGDGRSDLVWRSDYGGVEIAFSTGSDFNGPRWTLNVCKNDGSPGDGGCNGENNHKYIYHADINGDSLTDTCYRADTGMRCRINNGIGWSNQVISSASPICDEGSVNTSDGVCNDENNWDYIRFQDMDGDSKADLIWRSDRRGIMVALSEGDKFSSNYLSVPVCQDNPHGNNYHCNGENNWRSISFGDFTNDGETDIFYRSDYGLRTVRGFNLDTPRIQQIENGLGAITSIEYARLTDESESLYEKDHGSAYPEINYTAPMVAVKNFKSYESNGNWTGTSFRYGGAKVNVVGRGPLGNRWFESTNMKSGISEYEEYHQQFPLTGMLKFSETRLPSGALLASRNNEYEVRNLGFGNSLRYFPTIKKTIAREYELGQHGSPFKTTVAENNYSASDVLNGNATSTTVSVYEGSIGSAAHITTTQNQYNDNTSLWHLGRLTRTSVTRTAPNGDSQTRTSAFEYSASTGVLFREIVEPDNSAFRVQTDYSYDSQGNTTQETVSGSGVQSRTTTTSYSADKRFAVRVTNPLGHSATTEYNSLTGKPLRATDANGKVTTWTHDNFGRPLTETQPAITKTTTSREWCQYSDCFGATGGKFKLTTTTQRTNSATLLSINSVVYDSLERPVLKTSRGFDGQWVDQITQYDNRRRVWKTSTPHYRGSNRYWTTTTYDALDRPIRMTSPRSDDYSGTIVTRIEYSGFDTRQFDALGRKTTKSINALGKTVAITDPNFNTLRHFYDAYDNLVETRDAVGNSTFVSYDLMGRKTAMSDGDMGNWSYGYDVFGQLVSQTDANGNTSTLQYDKLGRMISRSEPEGTTSWVYDTRWKGALSYVRAPHSDNYRKDHFYDSHGRVIQTTLQNSGKTFVTKSEYLGGSAQGDARVAVIEYPSKLRIQNHYSSAYGYLEKVTNASNHNEIYWELNSVDALGNTIAETFGNGVRTDKEFDQARGHLNSIISGTNTMPNIQSLGYSWDAIGNLNMRSDWNANMDEAFEYDNMNRLVRSTLDGAENLAMVYDEVGNILSKSNMGDYEYNSSRPHAVTRVQKNDRSVVNYSYDANGNMLSGDGREVEWTSFNKPKYITKTQTNQFPGDATQVNPTTGTNQQWVPEHDSKEAGGAAFRVWWSAPDPGDLVNTNCEVAGVHMPGQCTIEFKHFYVYGHSIAGDHYSWVRRYSEEKRHGTALSVQGDVVEHNVSAVYTLTNILGQKSDHHVHFSGANRTTLGSETVVTGTSLFAYGPGRARYKQISSRLVANSDVFTTTYYVGKAYEEVLEAGETKYRHFIYAGGKAIAIYTSKKQGSSSIGLTKHFLHRDHLGSVDAITDHTGALVERNSFDAFGKRRQLNWEDDDQGALLYDTEQVTNRGYTGHEQLDHVGLIHMNGRVYDAALGRFLSADPNVQFPNSTQGMNRYTYVNNNPLSYTDPSGFFLKKFESQFRHEIRREGSLLGAAIIIVAAIICNACSAGLAAAVTGATAAAVSRAQGASWGDSIRAGVIAGATAYASVRIGNAVKAGKLSRVEAGIAHGGVGGAASVAQGGEFHSGFASSFFTKLAGGEIAGRAPENLAAQATVAAIVGGTASEIAGGKFANGAVTAAMQHLLNEVGKPLTLKEIRQLPFDEHQDLTEQVNQHGRILEELLLEGASISGMYEGVTAANENQAAAAIDDDLVAIKSALHTGAPNAVGNGIVNFFNDALVFFNGYSRAATAAGTALNRAGTGIDFSNRLISPKSYVNADVSSTGVVVRRYLAQ